MLISEFETTVRLTVSKSSNGGEPKLAFHVNYKKLRDKSKNIQKVFLKVKAFAFYHPEVLFDKTLCKRTRAHTLNARNRKTERKSSHES